MSNKNSDDYKHTSEQLDSITVTVVTTVMSAFIISQDLFGQNENLVVKIASVFALITLFLHYVSCLLAHYAQIYNLQNKAELLSFFGWWTRKVNGLVYIMVSILFAFAIWIILVR